MAAYLTQVYEGVDDGEIYVPIKQRRAMKAAALKAAAQGGLQQKEKRPRGLVADSTELC